MQWDCDVAVCDWVSEPICRKNLALETCVHVQYVSAFYTFFSSSASLSVFTCWLPLAETYLIFSYSKQAILISLSLFLSLPLSTHALFNVHAEAFLHHQGLKPPTTRSIQLAKQRSGLIDDIAQGMKKKGQWEQGGEGGIIEVIESESALKIFNSMFLILILRTLF